jgi:hypothetical protein
MTEREYKDFLRNPVDFLNHPHKYLSIDNKIKDCESLMFRIDICDYKSLINYWGPGIDFVEEEARRLNFRGFIPHAMRYRDLKHRPLHYNYNNQGEYIDLIRQDSEAMVMPVYIGYSKCGPDWCLRVSAIEGKVKGVVHKTIKDQAYYLQWGPDKGYVITLRDKAKFFLTDQLSGCGILIFETAHTLIIIHHNRRSVDNPQLTRFEIMEIARKIKKSNPNILRYTYRDFLDYYPQRSASSDVAGIFGVKSDGRWSVYFNKYASSRTKRETCRIWPPE